MKNIHEMKLGEVEDLNEFSDMTRVPGGWVYTERTSNFEEDYRISSVFIPYSYEFKPPRGKEKS